MGLLFGGFSSLLREIIVTVPLVLICLMGHELAHAWVSTKFGDPTPKFEGRLTLNPLKHLDPLGTVLMILTGFGWAKPVPVNPMYYKDRKKGMAIVAAAGPLSNLAMATVAFAIFVLLGKTLGFGWLSYSLAGDILMTFIGMNLSLMVFNLIPLPPLDGSKILGMFLPNRIYYNMLQYEQYAIIILMVLSVAGVFERIIGTGVNIVFRALVLLFTPFGI